MFSHLRLRKILRDLWNFKTRTTLVVLTIAIGAFAVGTIARTWVILSRELAQEYANVNPASITLRRRVAEVAARERPGRRLVLPRCVVPVLQYRTAGAGRG